MNSLARNITAKKYLTVLDFSASNVTALIAEKAKDNTFHILGAGEEDLDGMERGEFTHLGDAVESVVGALRKAELAAGVRAEQIFYNFDDPKIEGKRSRGSKTLKGEGEIRVADVQEACEVAKRLISHFEKQIVYVKQVSFLIDDKDLVLNPIGVFGRKLDVVAYILRARSDYYELWQKLMKRSRIDASVPVLTAWSTAYGVLPKDQRKTKKFIIDLGQDYFTFFIYLNDAICDYELILAETADAKLGSEKIIPVVKGFLARHGDIEKILVTGAMALEEEYWKPITLETAIHCQQAFPSGVPKLTHPRYASLVGLLQVADEIKKTSSLLHRDRGFIKNVKDKTVSFLNEYF